jgi:hypothetical protein
MKKAPHLCLTGNLQFIRNIHVPTNPPNMHTLSLQTSLPSCLRVAPGNINGRLSPNILANVATRLPSNIIVTESSIAEIDANAALQPGPLPPNVRVRGSNIIGGTLDPSVKVSITYALGERLHEWVLVGCLPCHAVPSWRVCCFFVAPWSLMLALPPCRLVAAH